MSRANNLIQIQEVIDMTIAFRKVKNEQIWKAANGTTIRYNPFFELFDVNRGTFFASAKTLQEAKKIASTDLRFCR